MTDQCEEISCCYENAGEDKEGFLLIRIFNNEADRNLSAKRILNEAIVDYKYETLRPLACRLSDYASITAQEMADYFVLSNEGWDSDFEKWLDIKGRTVSEMQFIFEQLIPLVDAKVESADQRLRVQLIFNDGSDDNDPWYTYFIPNKNGGFYTAGFADDPTDAILRKNQAGDFSFEAGEISMVSISMLGDDDLICAIGSKEGTRQYKFRRTKANSFNLG